MDKEFVFGSKISVNFCNTADCEFSVSPSKRTNGSSNEVSESSSSSRDSSSSPARESKAHNNHLICKNFDFPPPPVLDSQTLPTLLKNSFSFKDIQLQKCARSPSIFPAPPTMEIFKDSKNFQLDWNPGKNNNVSTKIPDISAFSPFKKDSDTKLKYPQKNVGRVSPFVMQDCDKNIRSTHFDPSNIRHSSSQIVNTSNAYLFSNNGYQNSMQSVGSSFDIPHISDPFFYSSTWSAASTTTMSDSVLSIMRCNPVAAIDNSSSVELYVSNLDPTFDVNEMKKVLLSVFREHVMVLHISMSLQPDGSAKATVKVPSLQDAQYAISRLHRKKIGHKRILISYVTSDKTPPFHVLKSETIALLNDIPTKSLPLIKFRELYEKRYHRPIAVSELYKMREAVTIQGDSGSRIVYLNSEYCNTPSIPESEDSQESNNIERPYCEVHFHVSPSEGWAEQYNICPLPLVHISLKTLATAVHTLLDSHQGSLPLISFCDCYEAEIGPLPIVGCVTNKDESFEISLDVNQTLVSKGCKGVPLEHLIACIAGVEVAKSVFCIKKVQWLGNKTENPAVQNFSPPLLGQLTLFGREVMDLLKSQPQCLVQFNKFIPTYHHHFGRQCRVADYGFTKLIDLLEAIPHIVQVLGEGQNRQVTLTHRTQVKRFAAELLRILKSRASKQIAISEFAEAYEQVIEKPFEITNYGVCEIEDMLDEVPENVVVTSTSGNDTIISIPKREQTSEEIERTKQFSEEVVELMKHTTNCSMTFNKFIPSYHHHFGKQCRVADYGFTKLIELFEAIPYVLEVKGAGEDKILKLVESEQHKILSERLITVIKSQPTEMVDLSQLCGAYAQVHGHALRSTDFGFSDLNELLEKLNSTFKVLYRSRKPYVCLVDKELIHQISLNIRRLLMEDREGRMSMEDVCRLYQLRFGLNTDLTSYFRDIKDDVEITGEFLELTPLQLLARELILLLQDNCAQIPLSSLASLYHQKYGIALTISNYGFKSLHSLLEHLSDYFVIKGKKLKRMVHLTPDTAENPLPAHQMLPQVIKKLSNLDIIDEPVPSCIPSPNIAPHISDDWEDLMGFETPPVQDLFCVPEEIFKSKLQNENSAKPNVIRTFNSFETPSLIENELSLTCCPCSSASTLNYSLPSYEFCCRSSSLVPQTSSPQFQETTSNTHQEAEVPIYTVIDIPKQSISLWGSKQLKSDQSEEKPNYYEQSFPSSSVEKRVINAQSPEDVIQHNSRPFCTKDDISSTKSTPCSESRLQSRRNRIAAQFSAPIDE